MTDRVYRRRAGWALPAGLLTSVDELAAERDVPPSTIAEDALALGLAELMVADALADVTGGMTTGTARRGHTVDTNADR